ncbi:hypothetical protein KCU83_g530, partial [Aureobasidium melanogenum]
MHVGGCECRCSRLATKKRTKKMKSGTQSMAGHWVPTMLRIVLSFPLFLFVRLCCNRKKPMECIDLTKISLARPPIGQHSRHKCMTLSNLERPSDWEGPRFL